MYWYLATPYTKYPGGLEVAYRDASIQAAMLIEAGIYVFCPIAHSHPIAVHGGLPTCDHKLWLAFDECMMSCAQGMIQCRLEGWDQSYGMDFEKRWFERLGKPVIPMEPGVIPDIGER